MLISPYRRLLLSGQVRPRLFEFGDQSVLARLGEPLHTEPRLPYAARLDRLRQHVEDVRFATGGGRDGQTEAGGGCGGGGCARSVIIQLITNKYNNMNKILKIIKQNIMNFMHCNHLLRLPSSARISPLLRLPILQLLQLSPVLQLLQLLLLS